MKPFSQQMGVSDKYADAARMAMSHPAMLDHADRHHVQFGSVAQFKVGQNIFKNFPKSFLSYILFRKTNPDMVHKLI